MTQTSHNTIAPSKSTVYVSNLPFSLTNNDLHKLFSHHGKIARVTIQKDCHTRLSKGVAFVLYAERSSAVDCVSEHHQTQIGGRMVKCSLANDNGRTTEFIKKRDYSDRSRCFECGESGHISYTCQKNLLGDREPPKKKKRKKMIEDEQEESINNEEDEDEEVESLGAAIAFQRMKEGNEIKDNSLKPTTTSKRKYIKDDYFSDEEHLD